MGLHYNGWGAMRVGRSATLGIDRSERIPGVNNILALQVEVIHMEGRGIPAT